MSGPRRGTLLFNPRAGAHRRKRLATIEAALRAGGWRLESLPTTGPDHCRELARAAVGRDEEALFVLGGDGTLRVVASVLSGSSVALGPLPGGTTNVVAHALGLPSDPVAAALRLAAGEARAFDLGRAGDEVFLMQLSGGLDAAVLARVDPRLKRRVGKGAVVAAGMRELLRYRFPVYRLEVDGRELQVTGFVVANLAEYAGSARIVPSARADDGRLDLLLFHGARRRAAAGFALDLARGRHLRRPDVRVLPCERARVLGPEGAALQVDGDPFRPALPLEVGLAAGALRLLVPLPA
jgi:diacylglycerol kinase family enzyme